MLPEKNRPADVEPIPEQVHPNKFTRLANKFVLLALVVVAASMGIFLSWMLESRNVIDVKNAPVPTRTIAEHAEADGVIIMKLDYCKYKDVAGKARISFVSASRETFLPVGIETYTKHCDIREFPVLIPKDLPKGEYFVKFRFTYKINPVIEVTEEFDSKKFQVVDGNGIKTQ